MKIILIIILSIFYFTPLITTQDGGVSPIICSIAGEIWKSTESLILTDLPADCNIFTIGIFAFDQLGSSLVMIEDENIMKQLQDSQINVYLHVGFIYENNWISIFDPQIIDQFNTQSYNPLIKYLKDNKIGGIIIHCGDIYLPIENIDQKISNFITSIKKDVQQQLQVGLIIDGSTYTNFHKKELFDFTITNKVLDMYIIDTLNLNSCDFEAKRDGFLPITTTSPNMTTMELITNAVNASTMDDSKVYVSIQVYIIIPEDPDNKASPIFRTYSEYCEDKNDHPEWCANPSKLSYDQGAYANKFYKGLHIAYLDGDDYKYVCGCSKFPVTNTVIDGWKSKSLTACPALDT